MKAALVSVTLSAAAVMDGLFKKEKGISAAHYLDEGLQALVQREGAVTRNSLSRLHALLSLAVSDSSDVILLTCTVFTPHLGAVRERCTVPVISADGAMMNRAAETGGRTAILCTFEPAAVTSRQVYAEACRTVGKDNRSDIFLLEDAAQAMKEGDVGKHDRLISERAAELTERYDQLVLAQMSMAGAAGLIKSPRAKVLTSPRCALEAVLEKMGEG